MSQTGRLAHVAGVTLTLANLLRTFDQARAAVLEDVTEGVESAAHVLLRVLHEDGPMRGSTLAEALGLDKSTVSRRVASLVQEGLIERRADPDDGRACILVPTAAGCEVIDENSRRRLDFFAQILAEWDTASVEELDRLLARFAEDYATAHLDWMSERHRRHEPPAPRLEPERPEQDRRRVAPTGSSTR